MKSAPPKRPAKAGLPHKVNGSPGAGTPGKPPLGPPAALSEVPAAAPGAKVRPARGTRSAAATAASTAASGGGPSSHPGSAPAAAPGTRRKGRSRRELKPDLAAGAKALSTPVAADPTHIRELVRDPANRRLHNERNLQMVVDSLRDVGAARSIVIDESNTVLAGNGVTEAAAEAGITRVRVIDADGDELIAVRRRGLSDADKRSLALFDNRAGELATWNFDQLQADAEAGLTLQPFWTAEEVEALMSAASADEIGAMAGEPGGEDDGPSEDAGPEMATFLCPLTVGQERIVRAALTEARTRYQVTTTGEALTAALEEWQRARR